MAVLAGWRWPAMIFAAALLSLATGLVIVDRGGEAAIAKQQANIATAAKDYFVAFAREEGVARLARVLDRRAQLGSPDGFRYAMVDRSGRMLAGADVVSSLDAPDAGWRTVVEPDTTPRRLWRVLAQPLDATRTLIVAEDLTARDGLRHAVLRGSIVALIITALGAAAGAAALNSLLMGRTRAIAEAAERIAAGDLTARVGGRSDGDAFDKLGLAVDHMLARIEELMTGMRAVTVAVAHDLRSPLTRLNAALQRAAAPEADEATRLAALDRAQGQLEVVLATLNALLEIARAESGVARKMMRRIDVGRLALEMGELFGPAAEDAGQTLEVRVDPAPMLAWSHETLLRQAVGNLLHNAIIHAGPGCAIRLKVMRSDDGVRVVVADTGRGVAAERLGCVPERYGHGAPDREAGSGLGLALAAACAKLHGGRLVLADNAPGLKAVLELSGREGAEPPLARQDAYA